MEPTNKPKLISHEIIRYLKILWRSDDKTYVDYDEAHLIQTIDSDEQYCHVEFPSDGIHIHMEDRPRVWRIADWKSDYDKMMKDKAYHDLHRRQLNVFTENRERIIKKLMFDLQTDNRELVIGLAEKMLRAEHSKDFARQHMKVFIDELPEK